MLEEQSIKKYGELKKAFTSVKDDYRPYSFLTLDGDISDDDYCASRISDIKSRGFGGVILLPSEKTEPKYLTPEYYEALAVLAKRCADSGLGVAAADDCMTSSSRPSGYAGGKFGELYPELCAKRLDREEYKCDEHESVALKIKTNGKLMSAIAYDEDSGESLFLYPYVKDGVLRYDMPDGNWVINTFYCRRQADCSHVNYLNYEASYKFAELAYSGLAKVSETLADTESLICVYDCIQYITENRRDWDDAFNEFFFGRFGFDPAPYYLSLFIDMGEDMSYYRGLLVHCRTDMLRYGFYKAVSDYANSHIMKITGSVAVPKAVSAPWIFGDGMRFQEKSDFAYAKLTHAYMYGLNCVKLASCASYNYGKEITICDMFREFNADEDIVYKETMNAFARGANRLWIRETCGRDIINEKYCDFVARCSAMLSGGRHTADIAVLYPISSLECQTYLFEHHDPSGGYEYPVVPSNADYMNVINSVMNYSGHDVTVLHPITLFKNCFIENDTLRLNSRTNPEVFKVLIIPGSSIICLETMRMVAKFFDCGGKIIATSCLPFSAIEQYRSPDASDELEKIIRRVFGVGRERNIFTDYFVNKNENGGVACFLHASATAVDGTDMTSPQMLNKALEDTGVNWDIIIGNMPSVEDNGILNLYYPLYMNLGDETVNRFGGMLNYIHRKYHDLDVYYISNTTKSNYEGVVSVRGDLPLEEWDPRNGKIRRLNSAHTVIGGSDYTEVELKLDSASSVFLVGNPEKNENPLKLFFMNTQK